jgi:hypothetical protein
MEVPYFRLKGRDLYSIGTWKGIFQGYLHIESGNWIMIFSNTQGIKEFTHKDRFILLETKQQSDQRKMERRALHLILRKVTGDPCFSTTIMDLK